MTETDDQAPGTGAEPMSRQVVHGAARSLVADVYAREALGAGDRPSGPAIVTQLDATTLIAPHWDGEVLDTGALLLTRA